MKKKKKYKALLTKKHKFTINNNNTERLKNRKQHKGI